MLLCVRGWDISIVIAEGGSKPALDRVAQSFETERAADENFAVPKFSGKTDEIFLISG